MKIEYWSYSGVKEDGSIENDVGQIHIEPRLDTSGNHHYQTYSAKQDGLWLSISTGRLPDETLYGITIYFDNEEEMRLFEHTRKVICKILK